MDRTSRPRHPSGRPIRRDSPIRSNWPRPPRYGYLTPRLNERGPSDAIGFQVGRLPGHQEDDETSSK